MKSGKLKKLTRDSKEKISSVSTPSSFKAGEKELKTDEIRQILNKNVAKAEEPDTQWNPDLKHLEIGKPVLSAQ